MAAINRNKRMTVSAKALYEAITDFANYPKFLSEVVSAKVLPGGTDKKQKVEFELEVMKRFQYTLEFSMVPEKEVSWKLVDSNFFKTNAGKWKLSAQGEETDVNYELEVGFGFLVPGFVTKKLTEVSLPKMFENFEERARTLEKKG